MVKKIKFYNGVYKKNKRYPTSFQAYIWGQLFYFGVTYFFFFFWWLYLKIKSLYILFY